MNVWCWLETTVFVKVITVGGSYSKAILMIFWMYQVNHQGTGLVGLELQCGLKVGGFSQMVKWKYWTYWQATRIYHLRKNVNFVNELSHCLRLGVVWKHHHMVELEHHTVFPAGTWRRNDVVLTSENIITWWNLKHHTVFPAGTWRQYDVVLTSMRRYRRIDVSTTLFLRVTGYVDFCFRNLINCVRWYKNRESVCGIKNWWLCYERNNEIKNMQWLYRLWTSSRCCL